MKRVLSAILAITMLLSTVVISPAAIAEEEDPVVSRFAVVSDVHTNPTSTKTTIDRLPKVFETAYAYAEAQGGKIDAFIFNGDSINGNETSAGYTNEQELAIFFDGVKENVKSESKVLLAMARTHDIYDGDGNIFYVQEAELNNAIAEHLGTDGSIIPDANWGYDPHLTMVNGVPVITLSNDMGNGNDVTKEDDGNTGNDDNADNSYHDSEDWLDTQLAALVAEKPNQPIFVVFHYPEVGKLGWTQRWGQNSLRDTLNKYPQVIAVNAHVHWDPRNVDSITQDLFTEVYDGAVRDAGGWGDGSEVVSYSMVEVTQSGAVTIKYIDPETGDLLKEANGSGEVLEYSIPKAWDRSTYLYTDEDKFAVEKATFAADASIKLEGGKTLTFDRADSEHPIIRYQVEINDGKTTKTQIIDSGMLKKNLPESYSTTLTLKTGINYTVTVTAIDGLFRESANTLTLTGNVNDPDLVLTGSATAATQKTYGENGAKGEIDHPDFKTYATNPDAAGITNWGISDMEDLKAWSDFSKSNSCAGLTFHLENDIDMKDEPFGMIGSVYFPFKGKFDGHLHTLSNLLIDDTSGMGTGFFVYAVDAEIKNFGIESGLVRGHVSNRKYENAGSYSLSGSKRTAFTDVIGVAAIAGRADNTDFSHVWNKADVTFRMSHMTIANGFSAACSAGLVGRAQLNCTFVGCYNTGDVYGLDRASGITNWAQNGTYIAQISNCFNLGAITTETGADTEAIGRYNTVSTTDNSYFCFNNYYLEGSATVPTNRASTGYTAAGAEEPIALTATEVKEDLAELLNAKRAYGILPDTAEWGTDEDGNVYIKSVDNNVAEKVITISTAAELNTFAANSKTNSYEGYTIVLQNDIDLSSTTNFAGIGSASYPFKGTFDGNNMTISKLTFTGTDTNRGMFTKLQKATVKNLTLSAPSMTSAGQNSAFLIGAEGGNSLIENVHITSGTLSATNAFQAGFLGSNASGTTFRNCSLVNCTFTNTANKQQQSCMVAGSAENATFDYCLITGNTIFAHRNGGIFSTYVKNTTVQNCITYGNNVTCNYDTFGILGGQSQGNAEVKNCVFYEGTGTMNKANTANTDKTSLHLVGVKHATYTVTATNVYNTKTSDLCAAIIPVTETALNSGEVAYKLGWAMKDGKTAFADEDTAAAKRYTYVINDETTEYRYTDGTGAIINGAPTVSDETFLGWKVANDTKEGDLIYTAYYGTTDDGAYPISEFASHPKAKKFTISTAEELCTLATLSKSNTFEGYTFTLLNDIDMSGVENFAMIGSTSNQFKGTFDGGTHTVYNLIVNKPDDGAVALISAVASATIKDLTVEDSSLTGNTVVAVVIGKAYGNNTTITNVKVRYSSAAVTANVSAGGIIGAVDKNGSYTLENCLVESSFIDALTTSKQQAGGLVGSHSYNVTVKNCKVINSTIQGHRQVGLISAYSQNLTVDGFIAYGNTLKCNVNSAGLISGQLTNTTSLKNVAIYGNAGTRCITTNDGSNEADIAIGKNATEFWLFGYHVTTAITGEKVFTDSKNDTCCALTPTTITKEQAKSGEVAYKLGYAVEYGNITFPDADTKAATKVTYLVNGGEYDARYTDSTGAVIGNAPALPAGATTAEWQKVNDTTYSTTMEYDVNGTYPISQFSIYSNAKNFTVSTAEEFKIFADLVTAGKTMSGVTIKQTASISLKDYPNVQVGTTRSETAAFAGTYDGQNKTISDYTFSSSNTYDGLFKGLAGTIKNLVIDGAKVSVASHSGILVGETYGTSNLIDNVHIKNSTMTAKNRRGSFITYGFNTGAFTIKNCTVSDSELFVGSAANQSTGLIAIKADSATPCVIENTYVFDNEITLGLAHNCGNIVGDGRGTQGITIRNCGSFNNDYLGSVQPSNLYGINSGSNANNSISNCFTDETKLAAGTFTGSNNYTGVTEAELADGSLAYKLKNNSTTYNWIQKDYPQVSATGKAVTKITYVNEGEPVATLYTDSTGAMIGNAPADPTKENYNFTQWTETADGTLGDKLRTATFEIKPAWIYVVEGETIATFYANTASEYTAPADPTKAGYLFVQWNAAVEGKNTTYTAEFKQNWSVNGDEGVDLSDVILLLQYLVGYNVEIDLACADVNKDGRVSIFDAVKLLQHFNSLQ